MPGQGRKARDAEVEIAALNAELDRRLRVFDSVIRHMIVRVDEELAIAERSRVHRKERDRKSVV